MHTCTAKMSAFGGHYSVFALLEFYWNVHFSHYGSYVDSSFLECEKLPSP